MSFKIQATVVQVMTTRTFTNREGKPGSITDVLVKTIEKFPKDLLLKVSVQVDPLKPGSKFEFDIDIKSREFNGKWYTDVNSWHYTPLTSQPEAVQETKPEPQQQSDFRDQGAYDALPF